MGGKKSLEGCAGEVFRGWDWKWCNSFLLTSLCLEFRHMATYSNNGAGKPYSDNSSGPIDEDEGRCSEEHFKRKACSCVLATAR